MAGIKPIFKYFSDTDKTRFKNSQCLLTISVGQATHESEMFAATMDLVNTSFGSCIILVDDSLQRHTMALNSNKDADFYYDISIKEGDLWLARNQLSYEKLTIPKKIMRWDKWLKHPKFSMQQQQIKSLINDDHVYRDSFKQSIDEFLKKYRQRLSDQNGFSLEKAWQLSFDFVVEECTALCLWPELQCQFEVYPNRHNAAIEETRRRFVLSSHPDLLHAVTIGFRNAKQMKSQRFSLLEPTEKHRSIHGIHT